MTRYAELDQETRREVELLLQDPPGQCTRVGRPHVPFGSAGGRGT